MDLNEILNSVKHARRAIGHARMPDGSLKLNCDGARELLWFLQTIETRIEELNPHTIFPNFISESGLQELAGNPIPKYEGNVVSLFVEP